MVVRIDAINHDDFATHVAVPCLEPDETTFFVFLTETNFSVLVLVLQVPLQ